MTNDSDYSKFRDFLIPMAKNSLESARDSHEKEEYDRAERNLDAAKRVIRDCRKQLQEDKDDAD
jgi:hypothetical protein